MIKSPQLNNIQYNNNIPRRSINDIRVFIEWHTYTYLVDIM